MNTIEKLARAFRIGVFRFTLKPEEPLFVPAVNKTNMLRGAFGTAFRRLCCIPQCRDARQCPLAAACPYKQVFEPSPPPESDRLSKSQDVPRPFIFRATADTKTKFLPGEEFVFELVLIGRALDFLPYFVLSFRELAAQGLGLNRAKCQLESVEESALSDGESSGLDSGEKKSPAKKASAQVVQVYSFADQVFHPPKGLDVEQWLSTRLSSLQGTSSPDNAMTRFPGCPLKSSADHQVLKVSFLTPTLLKSEGAVVRRPEFHHLLKRLRDRINALSVFFGAGPLDMDFAGFGRRAEQMRTVSCNVQWEERFRTSSKTHQRHELSGFTGSAEFQGEFQEFLPWMALGELIQVGKHTAWGLGRICVQITWYIY